MPKKPTLKKILIICSGPIVIGQAAEFDYSGTQACKAIREEGIETVLANSNPATIMTDKGIADTVYMEPLTEEALEQFNENICEEANIATHYAFDDVMTIDRALVSLYDEGLGYPTAVLAVIREFESALVSLTSELDPESPLVGEENIFDY